MTNDKFLEYARRLARETQFQSGLVLRMASEAEKAALESKRQRIRLAAADDLSELRKRRGDVLILDWSSGQRAVFEDNVIPFPGKFRSRHV